MKLDFKNRDAQPHTPSKGCCVKWFVAEERRFYKTSSFRYGWDESTSELIVTDLLEGSPFPFVSYKPCSINFIYRNEERTEPGTWCNSFIEPGEQYVDVYSILENKRAVKKFNDGMSVKERYAFVTDTLSNCIGTDSRPFINFMMSLDFVIGNGDRHCGNFGLVKQLDKTHRLAPIFDNGLSLWAKRFIPGDESDPFSSMARTQIEHTKSKLFLDFIETRPIETILEKHKESVDVRALEKFIRERIAYLHEILSPKSISIE